MFAVVVASTRAGVDELPPQQRAALAQASASVMLWPDTSLDEDGDEAFSGTVYDSSFEYYFDTTTLAELSEAYKEEFGVDVSSQTMSRTLAAMNLTKKRGLPAPGGAEVGRSGVSSCIHCRIERDERRKAGVHR